MRRVTLTRTETGDSGTFGVIKTDSGFSCYSGELPWRKNVKELSCIPAGAYICHRALSPKRGSCYYVTDVPGGRTDIEIHRGNFCGDVTRGLKSDVEGCIIVGNAIGQIAGQDCVISSREALGRLEADLIGEAFQLVISWGNNLDPEKEAAS